MSTPIARRLQNVKNIIIVLSGKGGVGKSSVSVQLALSLYNSSPTARVAILDVDLTGPSIPRMMGVDGHAVHQSTDGWIPVIVDGEQGRLVCMSVGFLLKRKEDSVVWRGPKKNAMIRQFLSDVRWGDLDYLVIDTPPGTSDEHLSLLEHLAPVHDKLSSVLVTTPQVVALTDMGKCLTFTRTVNLPVIGLIENMSGYVCPCCGEVSNVFSTGGGKAMCERDGLRFLGSLPIDTDLVALLDASIETGKGNDLSNSSHNAPAVKGIASLSLIQKYQNTHSSKLMQSIALTVENAIRDLQTPQ
ncbi:P-loop containing nucleoside triphosphate hydrolase protein [Serendipita vermifera]|nr:P-loop containing nucleoside triphosphate hydrolase protein [Serendipita vermifera]